MTNLTKTPEPSGGWILRDLYGPLMRSSPKVTNTIVQDACWICNRRFIDSGGTDPSVIRNQHHVVPQAAGGTDGPTVTLCSSHHDLLHWVAEKASSHRRLRNDFQRLAGEIDNLLNGLPGAAKARVIYLADIVTRAFAATANDPNKRTGISVNATPELLSKLDALKRALGVRSRESALVLIVEESYKRRFLG